MMTMGLANSKRLLRMLAPLGLLGLLNACAKQEQATAWVKPTTSSLGCEDYQTHAIDQGVLYNNVWNKQADTTGQGIQCLESRESDGVTEFGWSWHWPKTQRAVFGYPQIKLGTSPWAPLPAGDARFPVQISQLNKLRLAFAVDTNSDGDFNLATSLWLLREPLTSDKAEPEKIAAEVMLWTYATQGQFSPAGKKLGEFQLENQAWELWADGDWRDVSGANANHWVYIVFKAKQNALVADVNLLALLQQAVAKKLIAADFYVADIELGNEVMGGSGISWVKSFQLELE